MSDMTGSIEVRGETYEVGFSSWSGTFGAVVNGRRITSKTWDGLKSAIGADLRKNDVRVEVPFRNMVDGRTGVAYKIHAKLKKPMVKWDDDGTTDTVDVQRLMAFDADYVKLKALRKVAWEARKAMEEFEQECKDPRVARTYEGLSELVSKAIEAKVTADQAEAEAADTNALKANAVDLDT